MTSPPAPVAAPPHFVLRVSAFFGGYFLNPGVVLPWFPVWLHGRGLSDVEIASVIAIPLAVRVSMAPLGGYIADKTPTRRFAARLFLVPAAFVFLFAWTASTYWPLLLITGAAFALWQMALPAGEALALTGARRFGFDYGRMRLWGSVAFITANVGSGFLLGFLPVEAIFWLIFAALIIAAGTAFALPMNPRVVRAIDDATRPDTRPAWKVLTHPAVLAPILAGALIQGSHGAFYSFGSLYWQSLGFTPLQIGGFWAVSITCEILLFIFAGQVVQRIGPFAMLVIGGVAAIVRWNLLPFDLGGAGFMMLQAFHALTFAAVFLGNQYLVVRAVPEEMAASVQSVMMMTVGLATAGTTAVSGPLYAAFGPDAFRFMTVLPMIALAILGVFHVFLRKRY